jgi:mannose-1-phosphate guanylyltransferase
MRRAPIHAVVLAGGAGTRFWPLSREARPKPLLRPTGGRSLLEETLARARRFAARDGVWLVCGREHAAAMRRASGLPAGRVLVEPAMRNTAAAVAVAAARIAAEAPDAVMAVLPADHHIPDATAFAAAIRRAAAAAAGAGARGTLGVKPTRAETGYGYIRLGSAAGSRHPGLHRVARFVEKPDAARARRFLRDGKSLWNAGIFVWTARTFLEELEAHAPEVAGPLAGLRGAGAGVAGFRRAMASAYRRVPSLPVDRAVLERSRRVWCLPVTFHWSDVGTWLSLAQELGVSPNVTRIMDGDAMLCDAEGNLVRGGDRLVVLLGVKGLAVIDAGDAILVADLERSGEVRDVVARLRAAGRRDLL